MEKRVRCMISSLGSKESGSMPYCMVNGENDWAISINHFKILAGESGKL
jgi:hypothetical protein